MKRGDDLRSLEAFLKSEDVLPSNKHVLVSNRFLNDEKQTILWEIRAITEHENKILKQSSSSKYEYFGKLCVACTVYPILKDRELWKSYDAKNAEDLLKKMLYIGEYVLLLKEVQSLNGFEEREIERKQEAKN